MCSVKLYTDETRDIVGQVPARRGSFLSEDGLIFYTTTAVGIIVEVNNRTPTV